MAEPSVEEAFIARATEIMNEQVDPEETESVEEDEAVADTVEDGDDSPEAEDEEDDAEGEEEPEDDDAPRISLRIDGKKAAPEDVLKHMVFTPVVDGEEIEVSYDELLAGYQRGKDYSTKTTELKRQTQEMQPYTQMVAYAKHDPQFMDYVQGYFTNGPDAQMNSNPLVRVTDAQLADMMDQNSDAYDPKKAGDVVKARSEWQKQAVERRQVNQRAQEEMARQYQAWAGEQISIAQQTIDQMSGEGSYQNKGSDVLDFLHKQGFNDEEISGARLLSATDARLAILGYMAAEYDRMIKEAEAPKVRLGKKRKQSLPPRIQPSGTGTRSVSGSRKQRDNYRKAVNSQKEDDWISVIKGRMNLK